MQEREQRGDLRLQKGQVSTAFSLNSADRGKAYFIFASAAKTINNETTKMYYNTQQEDGFLSSSAKEEGSGGAADWVL